MTRMNGAAEAANGGARPDPIASMAKMAFETVANRPVAHPAEARRIAQAIYDDTLSDLWHEVERDPNRCRNIDQMVEALERHLVELLCELNRTPEDAIPGYEGEQ